MRKIIGGVNMPDITMSSSINCPMQESCYRVKAMPEKLQSWSNYEYSCNEDNGFENYIKMRND